MRDSYLYRVLVAIDQLGNTLADGNPDVTISARSGYYAHVEQTVYRPWWKIMQLTIDFAFYPLDGPGHCLSAYRIDTVEKHHEGNDLARGLLGIIILFACIPISVVTRLWVLAVPTARFDHPQRTNN